MDYQETIKAWAADRYKLNIEDIEDVDFDMEHRSDGYCETCFYSEVYLEVVVRVKGITKYFEEPRWDFGELIRSIAEFGKDA